MRILKTSSANVLPGSNTVCASSLVYPMMVAVDFRSLRHIHRRPQGLVITVAVNWLIKPFTMAALGVFFSPGFLLT